jgi:hypothetical protein
VLGHVVDVVGHEVLHYGQVGDRGGVQGYVHRAGLVRDWAGGFSARGDAPGKPGRLNRS